MISNEKAILLGKKINLTEEREKIIIKLNAFSRSLIENCNTVLFDDLEEMDDKKIDVFSEELIKHIKELRKNGEKLKKVKTANGSE